MKRTAIWALVGAFVLISVVGASALAANTGASHQIGRIFIGDSEKTIHTVNATITPAEAKSIAENYTKGTAISVELENENGYLVYGVHIKNQTGRYDVKIDAGNGTVLKVESDSGMDVNETGGLDNETVEQVNHSGEYSH